MSRIDPPRAVRGWLLVLCLMLTIVGPLISVWLISRTYVAFAPAMEQSAGLELTLLVSTAITIGALAYGAYAGIALWLVTPHAVATARSALLLGLAADIVTTVIEVVARPMAADQSTFWRVGVDLIPSILFFTMCLAYLNRSDRVHATYSADPG